MAIRNLKLYANQYGINSFPCSLQGAVNIFTRESFDKLPDQLAFPVIKPELRSGGDLIFLDRRIFPAIQVDSDDGVETQGERTGQDCASNQLLNLSSESDSQDQSIISRPTALPRY